MWKLITGVFTLLIAGCVLPSTPQEFNQTGINDVLDKYQPLKGLTLEFQSAPGKIYRSRNQQTEISARDAESSASEPHFSSIQGQSVVCPAGMQDAFTTVTEKLYGPTRDDSLKVQLIPTIGGLVIERPLFGSKTHTAITTMQLRVRDARGETLWIEDFRQEVPLFSESFEGQSKEIPEAIEAAARASCSRAIKTFLLGARPSQLQPAP